MKKPRPDAEVKKRGITARQRGDGGTGGEKGDPAPMRPYGFSSAVGAQKYPQPMRLPTEEELRLKAAQRAAMVVRDGLDATKLQDRLGSLRP